MKLGILSCTEKAQYLDICSIGNVAIVRNGCTVNKQCMNQVSMDMEKT